MGIQLVLDKPYPVHPEYMKWKRCWSFWCASFEGGPEYKNAKDCDGEGTFIEHEQESAEGIKRRKRLATFRNYVRPILTRYNNFVFGNTVRRDQNNKNFVEWCKNVDMLGTCQHDFMKRAEQEAQKYGKYYVLFDTTKTDDKQTKAQAKAAKNRTFLVDLHPQFVVFPVHTGTALTEVLIHFPDDNTVRHYTSTTVQIGYLDAKGRVAVVSPVVEHDFGSLPVVEVTALADGSSQEKDIAEINKSIFNLDSLLSEELYKHTFTQAFLLGGSSEDFADSITVGGRKLWCFKKKSDGVISTEKQQDLSLDSLSADATQSESICKEIDAKENEIYRIAGLHNPEALEKSDRASGRALIIKFNDVALMAASISGCAEKAENKIIDLYKHSTGEDVAYSEYPKADDFDSESLAEELDMTLKMLDSTLPETLKAEQVRILQTKFYPNLPETATAQMEQELQSGLGSPDDGDSDAPGEKGKDVTTDLERKGMAGVGVKRVVYPQ